MEDWINLHYKNKQGIVHVDDTRIGNLFVKEFGAVYLGEIKTSIGTYHKYSVDNLAGAYHSLSILIRMILR